MSDAESYQCINPAGSWEERECGGIANYHSPKCRAANNFALTPPADDVCEALRGTVTDAEVKAASVKYAEHVTGYSMRDGGRTHTCRCGWSKTGDDAQASAAEHRMRAALEAAAKEARS